MIQKGYITSYFAPHTWLRRDVNRWKILYYLFDWVGDSHFLPQILCWEWPCQDWWCLVLQALWQIMIWAMFLHGGLQRSAGCAPCPFCKLCKVKCNKPGKPWLYQEFTVNNSVTTVRQRKGEYCLYVGRLWFWQLCYMVRSTGIKKKLQVEISGWEDGKHLLMALRMSVMQHALSKTQKDAVKDSWHDLWALQT